MKALLRKIVEWLSRRCHLCGWRFGLARRGVLWDRRYVCKKCVEFEQRTLQNMLGALNQWDRVTLPAKVVAPSKTIAGDLWLTDGEGREIFLGRYFGSSFADACDTAFKNGHPEYGAYRAYLSTDESSPDQIVCTLGGQVIFCKEDVWATENEECD